MTALGGVGWTLRPPVRRGDAVADAADGVDLLIVAVPDGAIAAVAAEVTPVETTVVAHLAGSLGLDVLAPHPRRAAIHPLVALPNAEVGARAPAGGAWFAVAGDASAPSSWSTISAASGSTVADDDRAAYHAAAVIASNHLVAVARPGRAGGRAGRGAVRGLSRPRAGDRRQRRRARPRRRVDRARGPRRRRDHPAPSRLHCPRTSARRTRRSFAWPVGSWTDRRRVEEPAGASKNLPARRRIARLPTVDVHETIASFRAALDRERGAGSRVGRRPDDGLPPRRAPVA